MRSIYAIDDADIAADFVAQFGANLQDESCPPEIHRLGRTILRWQNQITAWHRCRHTNAPTEAITIRCLIKRIALGMRQFRHYRNCVMPNAGRTVWDLLPTITPL